MSVLWVYYNKAISFRRRPGSDTYLIFFTKSNLIFLSNVDCILFKKLEREIFLIFFRFSLKKFKKKISARLNESRLTKIPIFTPLKPLIFTPLFSDPLTRRMPWHSSQALAPFLEQSHSQSGLNPCPVVPVFRNGALYAPGLGSADPLFYQKLLADL